MPIHDILGKLRGWHFNRSNKVLAVENLRLQSRVMHPCQKHESILTMYG